MSTTITIDNDNVTIKTSLAELQEQYNSTKQADSVLSTHLELLSKHYNTNLIIRN